MKIKFYTGLIGLLIRLYPELKEYGVGPGRGIVGGLQQEDEAQIVITINNTKKTIAIDAYLGPLQAPRIVSVEPLPPPPPPE